jgi:hypothetical protein
MKEYTEFVWVITTKEEFTDGHSMASSMVFKTLDDAVGHYKWELKHLKEDGADLNEYTIDEGKGHYIAFGQKSDGSTIDISVNQKILF